MTMDQMNEYFEKRGFEVSRRRENGLYIFTISKDGNTLEDDFMYPATASYSEVASAQRKFVENMMKCFAERYYRKEGDNRYVYISSASIGYTPYDELMKTWKEYIKNDMKTTKGIYQQYVDPMEIKDVIFNDPATIVFWTDGTKTVVKCQEGDEFDPEKGLTMAIAKKVYGNKGSYCNVIKKWCEPYYEKQAEIENNKVNKALDRLCEAAKKAFIASAALNGIASSAVAREIKLAEKKRDYGFEPVTEHYGLMYLYNPDNVMGAPEYYVVHKDYINLGNDPEKRNRFFHSTNEENAKTVASHLEHENYILNRGSDS